MQVGLGGSDRVYQAYERLGLITMKFPSQVDLRKESLDVRISVTIT